MFYSIILFVLTFSFLIAAALGSFEVIEMTEVELAAANIIQIVCLVGAFTNQHISEKFK